MSRTVTEQDFRMPDFRDAKPEDYEFRSDGKLVRKDRWERGIGSIRLIVGVDGREFEIPDVVEAVRKLAQDSLDLTEEVNKAAGDAIWLEMKGPQ